MASPTDPESFSDVRKVGYLRKPKSMHKRFFVLRTSSKSGPARLEYYENEKKWRHKAGAPKRSIPLENCFNISKRADSKNKHLLILFTKDEHFAVAADSGQEQESWHRCLLELQSRGKSHVAPGEDSCGEAAPGPAFREVWQVILKPKGLGQTKNLLGVYRLCLTQRTINFVKLNSEAAAVVLQLMNIRRCGHSDNFFFMEVGRSAVTGPGEFWMQVDDSVVSQSMHEIILGAMKEVAEEFRPRSKSQSSSSCSNPISVPLRRHHFGNPPPSQVGLSRRSRAESVTATSPASSAKPGSFRLRASSDGEGTMSRPASADGSPVSPRPHRHRGAARLHPPLHHSRSIPMPSSRRSPSATSPVSLSSSSTSGHGSTSECLFPRRSSASVSGSPSDGGFVSSDEYGSSPCDFRSVTPESPDRSTPPARDGDPRDYMCMGKAVRADHSDPDKAFPRRNRTPRPATNEYTDMLPCRHSAFVPTLSYTEELRPDDGYMPMSPGVAPAPARTPDYMPMSVSAPQCITGPRQPEHVDSNGYMMMSPSGSCSPDGKLSADGNYMNVSPRPLHSYFSLPRSFKHVHRRKHDGRPLRAEDSSSSSASSDSLGGGPDGQRGPRKVDSAVQTESMAARPSRLSLDAGRASTLPRLREPPEPKSPGEYVNIAVSDKTFSTVESRVIPQREDPAEYMHMGLPQQPAPRDYVSMQLGAIAAAVADGGGEMPAAAPQELPGRGSGLSAFTRVSLSPSQSHSAKVIRADPQGRRRHSSETFSSAPSAARAGVAALPSGEDAKRHSSASFENVWLRKEQQAGMLQNGLNYIDLDLATDLPSAEGAPLQPKPSPGQPCGSTAGDDLGAYASISFRKSEDLRPNSAKTKE